MSNDKMVTLYDLAMERLGINGAIEESQQMAETLGGKITKTADSWSVHKTDSSIGNLFANRAVELLILKQKYESVYIAEFNSRYKLYKNIDSALDKTIKSMKDKLSKDIELIERMYPTSYRNVIEQALAAKEQIEKNEQVNKEILPTSYKESTFTRIVKRLF